MYAEDTIAAIATARGPGGIGIVRVSGPLAEKIAATIFVPDRRGEWQSHRLYPGRMLDSDGTTIDAAMAVIMRQPRSYTGEDVLELHCHGSPVVLERTLQAALQAGARPATAGEFSKQAFLNGKIDLVQAEAIADLVSARSPAVARGAADQFFGCLSRYLEDLRAELIDVKAKLEAQIDFSDEDIAFDDSQLPSLVVGVATRVEQLLQTYRHGRLLRSGIHVAIVGRPNVGKSSLLNALLGENRAIVTSTPGTTRDVIEENAAFEGIEIVLSDMAGLRDAPTEVEQIGVDRAKQVAQTADIRLVVLDRALPPDAPDEWFDVDHTIAVLNKIDLPSAWRDEDVEQLRQKCPVVEVSATEFEGLEDLRGAVLAEIGEMPSAELPVLTRTRHRDALAKALESLRLVSAALQENMPVDLAAVDLQAALDHIGSVTGAVSSEDVLDAIFAEFCVGK